MATVNVSFPGGIYPSGYTPAIPGYEDFNPSFSELVNFDTAVLLSRTSTAITLRLDNGLRVKINGTGFTFGSDGYATGGTISRFDLTMSNGTTVIQSIATSLSLQSFEDAVDGLDQWGLGSWLLRGNDTLNGSLGSDDLYGHGGNDTMNGGGGDDFIVGGAGRDTYNGGAGLDQISFSDAYNESSAYRGILLDAQTRTVIDPWGNSETFTSVESFRGSHFADVIRGSAADEEFMGLGGRDTLDGRGGFDTVRYHRDINQGGDHGVNVNLTTGVATDGFGRRDTLISIEGARGTGFGDTLTGSAVANALRGEGGNDTLNGLAGNDFLRGDGGRDTFVFNTALNASTNVDEIFDFSVVDDTIRLDNAIFTALTGVGVLTAAQFTKNAAGTALDASDRIIYEIDTGDLYYDANGSAAGGRVQFARLDDGLNLTAADFFIV